ncbi:MAG: hypothetical protein K8S24_06545 [Candidatus Aegiribacteria sp.]|nr:hypothetical protein [Candidatus Aegiribacteria sp.]
MKKQILSGLISIMLTLSLSCGNSVSPSTPAIQDGPWSGSLSLSGEPVTFTMEECEVTDLHVTFVYWGSGLPPDTVIWTPADEEAISNEFQMVDTLSIGYYSYSMSINGTFSSPSSVSGMFGTTGSYDSLGTHYTTSDSCSWSGSHE